MAIRREIITVEGTALYCDRCGSRGPQVAYDDAEGVTDAAADVGWTLDDNDRDLCPKCSALSAEGEKGEGTR